MAIGFMSMNLNCCFAMGGLSKKHDRSEAAPKAGVEGLMLVSIAAVRVFAKPGGAQ
ncbi:MAG: hypothetical protein ACOVRJ_05555 [Roseateles sp.]